MKRATKAACLAGVLAMGGAIGGCLELDGADLEFDLASNTGRVTIHGIGSDGTSGGVADGKVRENVESDFQSFMDEYVRGTGTLEELRNGLGIKAWSVRAKRVIEAGAALDGEVVFGFAGPMDLHLASYDRARPYLWCPPKELQVVAASAAFRTPAGCLVWNADAKVLRIALQKTHARDVQSLAEKWRATR